MSSVQFLLARKANPNARCIGGATAVHAACIRGSTTIVQQLILCGGDLRLRDDEGRTPCEWARDCQDPTARSRVIEFILRKRTDAYRLAERYVEDKLPTADGCALLKRRLSSGKLSMLLDFFLGVGGGTSMTCGQSVLTLHAFLFRWLNIRYISVVTFIATIINIIIGKP